MQLSDPHFLVFLFSGSMALPAMSVKNIKTERGGIRSQVFIFDNIVSQWASAKVIVWDQASHA